MHKLFFSFLNCIDRTQLKQNMAFKTRFISQLRRTRLHCTLCQTVAPHAPKRTVPNMRLTSVIGDDACSLRCHPACAVFPLLDASFIVVCGSVTSSELTDPTGSRSRGLIYPAVTGEYEWHKKSNRIPRSIVNLLQIRIVIGKSWNVISDKESSWEGVGLEGAHPRRHFFFCSFKKWYAMRIC